MLKELKRGAGILLPISSLPSPYGIGTFGKDAYHFVDQLEAAGQKYWKVLPIGPTNYGDSPYQSVSSFAGNPYFIDLDILVDQGYLLREEVKTEEFTRNEEYVEYELLYNNRYPLLYKAYSRWKEKEDLKFKQFKDENRNWLEDYSLYMACKDYFNHNEWLKWDVGIKNHMPNAVANYKEKLKQQIEFYSFLQYEFYSQWNDLKAYANDKNIIIIGDICSYISYDSVDVWVNPNVYSEFQKKSENLEIKILQNAFDGNSMNSNLPHNFTKNCVVYIGTHDNNTLIGYLDQLSEDNFKYLKNYLNIKSREEVANALIRITYMSVANLIILQMQDVLGKGNSARMNTPSTMGGNWTWRIKQGEFGEKTIETLKEMAVLYGRWEN